MTTGGSIRLMGYLDVGWGGGGAYSWHFGVDGEG